MAEDVKKPEVKKLTIEERVLGTETAVNALIMYINTLEKWRHMDFKPPPKVMEAKKDESTEPKEAAGKDSGKEKT